jgi:hypothetical protein
MMTVMEENITLTRPSGVRERIPDAGLDAEQVSTPRNEVTVVTAIAGSL